MYPAEPRPRGLLKRFSGRADVLREKDTGYGIDHEQDQEHEQEPRKE
jgi:hypothetical protein